MEYLSLYDYLGKAAGEELGREVAKAAIQNNINIQLREISNPKYTGNVSLYPRDFLEFYFRKPDSLEFESTSENTQYDDLPF